MAPAEPICLHATPAPVHQRWPQLRNRFSWCTVRVQSCRRRAIMKIHCGNLGPVFLAVVVASLLVVCSAGDGVTSGDSCQAVLKSGVYNTISSSNSGASYGQAQKSMCSSYSSYTYAYVIGLFVQPVAMHSCVNSQHICIATVSRPIGELPQRHNLLYWLHASCYNHRCCVAGITCRTAETWTPRVEVEPLQTANRTVTARALALTCRTGLSASGPAPTS
jgi:hypothetical protein